MAYQTGVANDPAQLLNLFAQFVATLPGWTVRRNQAGSGAELRTVVIQRGADEVWGLMARNDLAWFYRGATGWDAGAAWSAQPGGSATHRCGPLSSPVSAYHFFGSGDYVHMVVETTAGVFRHLHLGVLLKAGTYTGGAYGAATDIGTSPTMSAHAWPWDDQGTNATALSTFVRTDLNASPGYHRTSTALAITERLLCGYRSTYHLAGLWARGINDFAGNTALIPIRPVAGRTGGFYQPIGQVPDVRLCNLELSAPGESYAIGADEWLLFPVVSRGPVAVPTYPAHSGHFGLAYRKVA